MIAPRTGPSLGRARTLAALLALTSAPLLGACSLLIDGALGDKPSLNGGEGGGGGGGGGDSIDDAGMPCGPAGCMDAAKPPGMDAGKPIVDAGCKDSGKGKGGPEDCK